MSRDEGWTADDFREHKREKRERHAQWHVENRAIIDESGIEYVDKGETLLFRGTLVFADFYPSTGRWREIRTQRIYKGGARAFLAWPEEQNECKR